MANQFHELLLEHLPCLQAYAILLTRDRFRAEDLLQETALRALRAESQFTPGTNFTAWMFRILRNEYISSLRRKKRQPLAIDDVAPEVLSRRGDQENQLLAREIIDAMDRLPYGQREVLIMICGAGMTYEEVAEALNCSVGTVRSRLWRARDRMASLILGGDQPEVTDGRPVMPGDSPALAQTQ